MSWYTNGTVQTTANSTIVKGNNTSWIYAGLRSGDMLLIGNSTASPRGYEIKSVDSDSQITLVLPFPVTLSGVGYAGIPMLGGDRTAITMAIANQTTKALADTEAMSSVYQIFYTAPGSVSLKLPGGLVVTGSSFKKLTDDMNSKANLVGGAVPINQGGTGGINVAAARYNLQAMTNRALTDGSGGDWYAGFSSRIDFGIKSFGDTNDIVSPWDAPSKYTEVNYFPSTGSNIGMSIASSWGSAHDYYMNSKNSGVSGYQGWKGWSKLWHSRNTTVDSNGFIKRASPILRLTNGNLDVMEESFLSGFIVAGVSAINPEAEGVEAKKVSEGVYFITGSLGLAKDGWTVEVPQDVNGNRLLFVETEEGVSGGVTVRTFKRRFDMDTAMIVAGEPMDIPDGRWIDIRLQMPKSIDVILPPETPENISSLTDQGSTE